MAGFVGEIPGMYYDEDKKKYFKIQPSSAGPASSAYSSQDVKRRKLRDVKEAEATRVQARRKRRIQRSKIMMEPLAGGILQREYGRDGFEPASIFASGLVGEGYVPIDNAELRGTSMFTISYEPESGPSVFDFRYVCDGHIRLSRFDLEKSNHAFRNFRLGPDQCYADMIPGRPRNSDVTSACVHEANRFQAITWLSGYDQRGILISDIGLVEDGQPSIRRSIEIGPGILRGPNVAVFSSAAAPPASDLLFAFGTSKGVLVTDKHGEFNTYFTTPKVGPHFDDTFAVEFMSDNPSILLSGGRRGILEITDLRLPIARLDNDIITHPSSITHIRQLDASRIIVSGLNSSLCQYDLRLRKSDPRSTSAPKPTFQRCANKFPTAPILTYPSYHNTASHQAGFDIDFESGIIAAAQEADAYHPCVQLFSLHGGHKLDSRRADRFQCENDVDWLVKCLRFARDSDGAMKSLYVGHRLGVQRYAWAEHKSE